MRRKYLVLLFLLLFSSYSSEAQNAYVDSLKSVLSNSIEDTTRARIYIDLAEYIVEESEWTFYNKKALELADAKLESAKKEERKYYLKIKANAVGNEGYYFDDHGNRKMALEKYFESLRLYKRSGEISGQASILSNIGVLLTDQGDYTEALDYLNQALKLKKRYEPENVSKNYLNLGVAYENKGDTSKAINHYQKALKAAIKVDDHEDIATAYNNIGSYYYYRKDFKLAVDYLRRAVSEYELVGDGAGTAWALANIGSIKYQLGEIDSAYYYSKKAELIAEEYAYPELSQSIAEKLLDVHLYREEWKEAFKYYQFSIKMRDSINDVDAQKEAIRQKLEYDHDIETATMETKRKEEQKRSQQLFLFITSFLIIVIVFGLLLYRRLIITRKQKGTIESQKLEIEVKNKEVIDSINSAKRLQDAILPNPSDVVKCFNDAFLLYLPKDIVAGDFYWSYKKDNYVFVAAADCTGHGVPGALVSVICSNALDRATREFALIETGLILDKVRELVITQFEKSNEEVKNGMDIALCRIDLDSKMIQYSGAYNPLWIIREKGKGVEVVKGDRQPVGNFEFSKPFSSNNIQLSGGNWIYLFSDGFVDQFGGAQGKKFKSSNLRQLLLNNSEVTGEEQEQIYGEAFNDWKGDLEQIDDVCMIGVKL
jgi:serine phosphatase RsbU (regulator of sigma subunit)/tetratricopeptide (TPR) repeat protein